MAKKSTKKNPLKSVKFLLWVKPEAVGITPVSPALASPCASPYYCASVIPLHQKPLGGTVKAIIHHPTDFAGVRCPMQVCRSALYKTKESFIYMCVCVYVSIYIIFSCCSHASLNPWPMLYLNKSKETEGWCLTQQKIHQVQNPENSHRPPYRLCCVQWDVLCNFFVLHFTG
jgi:hypothetical protein